MHTDAPPFTTSTSPLRIPMLPTDWAERQTRELLSIPFVSEFVFRNMRTVDGKTPHQAGDFLILHRGTGILVEQKCQQDPTARNIEKTALWARKNARAGWKQLRRALTRPKDRPVWCDHQRRGRVEFPNGLPVIRHALVIVDVFQTVDLQSDAHELPLEFRNVPITYLSVNDFLNLAVSLRTVSELAEYLAARRSLPHRDLRVIGDEKTLFCFYLLNGGSFAGYLGKDDARIAITSQGYRLGQLLERKAESDHYSLLIEYVADSFAANHPKFEVGPFPSAPDDRVDHAQRMINSLELQAELADLRRGERAELGRAFDSVIQRLLNEKDGFVFRAVWLDSKPDWVYVFAASKNINPSELRSRTIALGRGAMSYYEKRRCLLVLDRDGRSIVTSLFRPEFTPTLADFEVGQRLFGHLRITTTPLEIAPESRV
jgi:hypothetical protein